MSFRSYRELDGEDRSHLMAQVVEQRERVKRRLASVRRVVAVVSGKGGVGKSYITASLALAAASRLDGVGVLDADLASPTVAHMLGARGSLTVRENGVEPALGRDDVKVVSTDLLLDDGQPLRWHEPSGDRFVWRGVQEVGTLREFLSDILWGQIELLLVDLPPGGAGLVDLSDLVPDLAGAVVVTIPSEESRRSVTRTVKLAAESGVPILGIVENMSGYHCVSCGDTGPLFPGSAGVLLAEEFHVPLLGTIPFDPGSATTPGASSPLADLLDRFLEAVG